MKYIWIITAVLGLIMILPWIYYYFRIRWARKKVCRRTDTRKNRDLNAALEPFGFQYEMSGDYFHSAMHAWQRKMGYSRFYDEKAPVMDMDIDSEPFYFSYNGYDWLIEVWKGQYGMATGGEVGIYRTPFRPDKRPEELFYESVPDEQRIPMSFSLRKKQRVLLERAEYHWWLTGFKMGEFSKKEELSMLVRLSFPNMEMRSAFYEAMRRVGYTRREISLERLTVSFLFDKPKNRQPKHNRLLMAWVRSKNRRNCKRYFRCTKVFRRTIDRVDYIGFSFPGFYKMLIRVGKSRSMAKAYKKLVKRGTY